MGIPESSLLMRISSALLITRVSDVCRYSQNIPTSGFSGVAQAIAVLNRSVCSADSKGFEREEHHM